MFALTPFNRIVTLVRPKRKYLSGAIDVSKGLFFFMMTYVPFGLNETYVMQEYFSENLCACVWARLSSILLEKNYIYFILCSKVHTKHISIVVCFVFICRQPFPLSVSLYVRFCVFLNALLLLSSFYG